MSTVSAPVRRSVTKKERRTLAAQATTVIVNDHRDHVTIDDPTKAKIHELRLMDFEERLLSGLTSWLDDHDFRGSFRIAGEYHPDGRLMAIAHEAGIENPLDAFPPHTEYLITRSGVEVAALPKAA